MKKIAICVFDGDEIIEKYELKAQWTQGAESEMGHANRGDLEELLKTCLHKEINKELPGILDRMCMAMAGPEEQ